MLGIPDVLKSDMNSEGIDKLSESLQVELKKPIDVSWFDKEYQHFYMTFYEHCFNEIQDEDAHVGILDMPLTCATLNIDNYK